MRNKKLINKPLELTLDTNIQFLIKKELDKALETFEATGGGALLMNVEKKIYFRSLVTNYVPNIFFFYN